MIGMTHRWVVSAASASLALFLFNPLTYLATNKLFSVGSGRDFIAEDAGRRPTWIGLLLHCVILFFAIFGILCINWDCE